MSAEPGLVLAAPAKVNLALDVIARRPDGFHDIRTVFQTIALLDDLEIAPAGDLIITCDVPGLEGEGNLVWRAAALLRDRHAPGQGAAIRLTKRIPVASGLGGGSSDAAATLVGLDNLWGLGLGEADLRGLATELGSDVAFFVGGGTQVATGRGEVLRPLPPLPPAWLVVWLPPIAIGAKTATLYGLLKTEDRHPTAGFEAAVAAIEAGHWPDPADLHNTFRSVYDREYPDLARWATHAQGLTGLPPLLSGAGPALFWRCEDEATARRYADFLNRPDSPAWAVPTCDQSPLRRA